MMRLLSILFTLIVAAVGQSETEESAQHQYARQQYEQAKQKIEHLRQEFDEAQDQMRRTKHKVWHPNKMETLDDRSRVLMNNINEAQPRLDLLRQRMENANACMEVFDSTLEKKVTDLTVRETESTKACQALGLYPPPTAIREK